ncbi:MAG: hypothetical protein A3G24_14425 [Betaproteobacteria bacterium RIFCSPLOWO2_12_FULL_62_13]|nr:MAG: hypothetical protein A3G24_14425 [Betaproteobacteria bacterium RIFCSPLOWO2_12_FULL_62_13]
MATLSEEILRLVTEKPGLPDRQITNALKATHAPQQPVNIEARNLASKGLIDRRNREDGLIGNYPTGHKILEVESSKSSSSETQRHATANLQEDALKRLLESWLHTSGWRAKIAWGNSRGADIIATRGSERWVIEVKGIGSRPEMRVNYFIGILGEILQRMDDANSKYSIALPDVAQFGRLWDHLPRVAKERTGITALFVNERGEILEKS